MAYTAIDRVYSIFIDVMTGVSSGSGSATFYNTDNHTSYIELTVTNGNQLFDMTEYSYVLVVSKPNKQTYRNEYTTTDASKLVIEMDSQMLAGSGNNKGQLYIMKTINSVAKVLTMVEFNYIVKEGNYTELAPESINHDALYITLRNDVDRILEMIESGEIGGGSGSGTGMTPEQKEQLATAYNHAMSDAVTTTDTVNSAVASYVEANKDTLKGEKGDKGDTGAKGDKGDAGADGADGITPTLQVGTVTTLAAGSDATVNMTGSNNVYTIDFGIPKGAKGDTGSSGGGEGTTVVNPTLDIGTVTGGAIADASITGDSPNYTLNLVLPKGEKGDTGATGATGAKGDKGDIGATGAKGDKGDKGEAGANGKDGLTTAVSVNGTTYTHVDGTVTLPDYPTVPTKTSELTNDSKFATESYVTTKISEASLGGGSVDLSEYAKTTEVNTAISTALDGHTFKFLTQAEYDALSDEEKNNETIVYNITDNDDTSALTSEEEVKLNAAYSHSQEVHAPANAEANVQADWNETDETSDAYIKNKPTSMGWDGILTSDGGRKFMLAVSDDGVLSAVEIINYANIVVSSGTLSMKEGTTATFTVALDSQPDRTQTVSLVSDNSFVTVSPETLTFTTDNYATAQTVTITATEDTSEHSGFNATVTLTSGISVSAIVNIAVANVTGTAPGDVTIGGITLPEYYLIAEVESNEDSTLKMSNVTKILIDLYTMDDVLVKSYTVDDLDENMFYTVPSASTRYKAVFTGINTSLIRPNYFMMDTPNIIKVNGILPGTIVSATRFMHNVSKLEYVNLNVNNCNMISSGQFINECKALKELHITNIPAESTPYLFMGAPNLEIVDEESWWKRELAYPQYFFCCALNDKLIANYPDMPKSWGGSKSIIPTEVILTIDGATEITEYTTASNFKLVPVTTPRYGDPGTFTVESGTDVLSVSSNTSKYNSYKFGDVTLKAAGVAVITYTVNGISKSITIHSTKA